MPQPEHFGAPDQPAVTSSSRRGPVSARRRKGLEHRFHQGDIVMHDCWHSQGFRRLGSDRRCPGGEEYGVVSERPAIAEIKTWGGSIVKYAKPPAVGLWPELQPADHLLCHFLQGKQRKRTDAQKYRDSAGFCYLSSTESAENGRLAEDNSCRRTGP